jgi:hypothetical protein
MPKKEIDYSNTIIYKIYCNDPAVTDVYVGHTTNFVQRKHAHKHSCSNLKTMNYNCKVYEVIRNNGGWSNWKMEIVNFYNCRDHYEARKKEQEYFVSLKATLNSIEPMPKPKVIVDKVVSTSTEKFNCEVCHFNCIKLSNYNKHLLTSKHCKANITYNINLTCETCSNNFKHASSLSRHKKKCNTNELSINEVPDEVPDEVDNNLINIFIKENTDFKNLLLQVVKNNSELLQQNQEYQKQNQEYQKQNQEYQKQNQDLQKQMLEICKKIQPNNTINNSQLTKRST